VAVWQHDEDDSRPRRAVEPLVFEALAPSARSYA
jgi:hypothetical protein